jgi:O-antigen/teichoic acid export membrane protein
MFMSIVSIVSQGSSLRYEGAINLPRQPGEALAIMALAYHVLFAVVLLLLLLLAVYEATGWQWATLEMLGAWKWLLPLGALLAGAAQLQDSWLARIKSFHLASASLVANNSITGVTRIGLGAWLGSSVYGLVISQLIGMMSQFCVQCLGTREGLRLALSRFDWQATKELARGYADFPKFNASAAVVRSVGSNLPVLLFGSLFSPAVAGFYAMANRLSRVPLGIVAESIRRVFLQKAATIHNRGGNLRKAFRLVIAGLAATGLVPFTILWLYGQPLLVLLLGEQWLVAGHYLEIMAPWLFSVWTAAPCNAIFVVLRAQKFFLARQTALTIARIVVLAATYLLTGDPEWTLWSFAIVAIVTNFLTIVHALRIIARDSRQHPAGEPPAQ